MSVVTGALGSLVPKLLQLIHGEYKLQKGVRKQVPPLRFYFFSGEHGELGAMVDDSAVPTVAG